MRGAGEAGEEERTPIEWELMQGRHEDLPDIKLQVQKNCVSSSFVEPPDPTRHKREILVLLDGSDGAEKSLTSRRSGDLPIRRRKSGRRNWAELD